MEGFSLIPLDQHVKDSLAKTYKVPADRCEIYDQFYNSAILPRIEEKFLAHLISTVEDLIFEKLRVEDRHVRRYRIVLWRSSPKNGKATMRAYAYGAIISYNPQNDPRDLRIFVAHELAHLLCRYKILDGEVTENNANLFAYFAIAGKNKFYKEKAPTLVYSGGDLEIISSIQAACPIIKSDQSK